MESRMKLPEQPEDILLKMLKIQQTRLLNGFIGLSSFALLGWMAIQAFNFIKGLF